MLLRLLCALLLVGAALDTRAQEICGLASVQFDPLFADGFEGLGEFASTASATSKSLTSKSQSNPHLNGRVARAEFTHAKQKTLGKALGFAPKIALGVVPTITITSPSNGANLSSRQFEIRGTFSGPVNTGIAVNGSPAQVLGTQWVVTSVRPSVGAFVINAVATTLDGLTALASHSVTVANSAPSISLIAKQNGALAPSVIGFSVNIVGTVVGNVQLDFDGDNNNDYDGALANVPSGFNYQVPGIYTARVQAVVNAIPTSAFATVVISDVITQRERGCAVYGAFREALTANDLEASVRTFTLRQQEALRPFFTGLANNKPVFATRLGTIANGAIGFDNAKFSVLRLEAGAPVLYALDIGMDEDGVWRIVSF